MAETLQCCGGLDQHEEWCPIHIRSALTWLDATQDGIRRREKAEVALEALIERDGLQHGLVAVPDVLPLARFLYQQASVGCCLHLPLASTQMDADTLRKSIQTASMKGHAHCETLGRVLLRMSEKQRERLAKTARK